jgi:hypothetical protein
MSRRKPACSYAQVSAWLQTITDPVTGQKYGPLKLDAAWWKANLTVKTRHFYTNSDRVIQNFKLGEHDYDATMELLVQSNPTLNPVLKP